MIRRTATLTGARLAAAGLVLVMAASCSSSADVTTTEPVVSNGTPSEVVAGWLGALASGSTPEARYIDDLRLAIILAVENGFSVAETAEVVTGGLTDSLRQSWWRSFATEFAAFGGEGLSDIEIGETATYTVGTETFAAVTLMRGDPTTEIILRQSDEGEWMIDMVATVGPTLVRPLRAAYVGLGGDEDAMAVRAAFRSVAGSLVAARQRDAINDALPETFLIEVDALADLLRVN